MIKLIESVSQFERVIPANYRNTKGCYYIVHDDYGTTETDCNGCHTSKPITNDDDRDGYPKEPNIMIYEPGIIYDGEIIEYPRVIRTNKFKNNQEVETLTDEDLANPRSKYYLIRAEDLDKSSDDGQVSLFDLSNEGDDYYD